MQCNRLRGNPGKVRNALHLNATGHTEIPEKCVVRCRKVHYELHMSRRTLPCAPAKRRWQQAPPPRLYARGAATDRHSPGVLRTPRKCLPLPSVGGGMEMMPSFHSGKVMPGLESLALPECHVGGNVYGDAKVNGSATATGWQYVTTGAGAMYAMPRPGAAVPALGQG